MNTIYLVRHGETQWNKSGKYQGKTDVPLNEIGLIQAAKCAEAMKDIHIDRIISSDLSRAYTTACAIADGRHIEVKKDKRLQEINFGDWESLTYDEITARWPGIIEEMYQHPATVAIQNGESFQQVQERAWKAVQDEIHSAQDGETILVVAHGGTNRTIICKMLGLSLDYCWNMSQGNTGITRLFYYGMGPRDHNVLNMLNDTKHIEDL